MRPSDFAGIANACRGDGSDIGALSRRHPPPGEQPPATKPLTIKLIATAKQKGTKLRTTVTCSKDCELNAQGKGKAGGEKFKTKSASLRYSAGVAAEVKLKLKSGDRKDVAGKGQGDDRRLHNRRRRKRRRQLQGRAQALSQSASTFHFSFAGVWSTLPAVSTARTWNSSSPASGACI